MADEKSPASLAPEAPEPAADVAPVVDAKESEALRRRRALGKAVFYGLTATPQERMIWPPGLGPAPGAR